MFNLDDLIVDRTQADIRNRTAKGFYNVSDLKRVNDYIQYLADKLNIVVEPIIFTVGEPLYLDKLTKIVDNIRVLRKAWYVAKDTPQIPAVSGWDFESANAIEKNLLAMSEFWQSYTKDTVFAGTAVAGTQITFRRGTK